MTWALILFSALAHAEPYVLEVTGFSDRPAAERAVADVDIGDASVQVVRRFERASGWRYAVRVDLDGDEALARSMAEDIEQRVGRVAYVYAQRANDLVPVVRQATVAPATATGNEAPAGADVAAGNTRERHWVTTTDGILTRIQRTHGGPHAAGRPHTELFRYVRTLPDGTRIEHTYARRGTDVYVEVHPASGSRYVASRAGIAQGKAWLDGHRESLDASRTRAVLSQFAPEAIMSIPLSFALGTIETDTFDAFRVGADVLVSGRDCVEIRSQGRRDKTPMAIAVDREDGRIRRVDVGVEGAKISREYGEYQAMESGGLRPGRITSRQGADIVDSVEVVQYAVDVALPDEWFHARRG